MHQLKIYLRGKHCFEDLPFLKRILTIKLSFESFLDSLLLFLCLKDKETGRMVFVSSSGEQSVLEGDISVECGGTTPEKDDTFHDAEDEVEPLDGSKDGEKEIYWEASEDKQNNYPVGCNSSNLTTEEKSESGSDKESKVSCAVIPATRQEEKFGCFGMFCVFCSCEFCNISIDEEVILIVDCPVTRHEGLRSSVISEQAADTGTKIKDREPVVTAFELEPCEPERFETSHKGKLKRAVERADQKSSIQHLNFPLSKTCSSVSPRKISEFIKRPTSGIFSEYILMILVFISVTSCSAAINSAENCGIRANSSDEMLAYLLELRNNSNAYVIREKNIWNISLISLRRMDILIIDVYYYYLWKDHRLCGNQLYNESSHICCDGIIHNVTYPSLAKCCKTDMYYPDRSVCLDTSTEDVNIKFPCVNTSCQWIYLPNLDGLWYHTKITIEVELSSREVFSILMTSWLKPQITINMADLKDLSYGSSFRRKSGKNKKERDTKDQDKESSCLQLSVLHASLVAVALTAALIDVYLVPVFFFTKIAHVAVCFCCMTLSVVVLYKMIDEMLLRKENKNKLENEDLVEIFFDRLFTLELYVFFTVSVLNILKVTEGFLIPFELITTIIIVDLEILMTSWLILLLCNTPFARYTSFLKVSVIDTIERFFRMAGNETPQRSSHVPLKESSMQKCSNNFHVDCLKDDFVHGAMANFEDEKQNRSNHNDANVELMNENSEQENHDLQDCLNNNCFEDKSGGVSLIKDNNSITQVTDEDQDAKDEDNGEDLCCNKNEFETECQEKLINRYGTCQKRDQSCQTECQEITNYSMENKGVQCTWENNEINNVCHEEEIIGKIDSKTEHGQFENDVDVDRLVSCDSSMLIDDPLMSKELKRYIGKECVKIESVLSSTEIIPERRNEDIHAETSLKTLSESSVSNNVCHDTTSDEDALSGDTSQNTELLPDHSYNACGKVWHDADCSVLPELHEYVIESNSLKSGNSYDSFDGKYSSTSSFDGKHVFSIGSSWSSLSYNRDLMVYNCHSSGSVENNIVDIKNVCTEHSTCNDVTGNHGTNQVGVVKGCFGNSDDSVQNRNVEITPSNTVIDLQKKQESKSTRMSPELRHSIDQTVDEEHLKTLVKDTIGEIFKNTIKKLSVKSSRKLRSAKRHSSRRYRRTVRRVLRRTIHHDRNELSPASVNGQVCPATNQLKNNIDNRPLVTTQSGAVAGISLDRPPIALPIPTSSSSLNNYFTKVMVGYNFDLDERMTYEMLRVESFQDLPASCQVSPLRMAKTGFFSRGNGDEVTCFSCGKQYKNWSPTDIPSEVHKRISPNCRMVIDTDPKNVPTVPHTNGYTTHNAMQDSLPNNTSGLIQTTHSTVHQDGDVSTSTVPENRPLTRQEIENANDPDRTPVTQQATRSVLEGEQRRPPQRDQAEELGIVLEKPKYPAYAQLNVRVSTFSGWPGYLDQSPRDMALAGFFYAGYNDYCRCFYCGGGLRNWDAGDDPWVEHARWFSKCSFVRQNRGHRFVEIIMKRQAEMQASGNTGGSRTQTTTAQGTDDASGGSPNTSVPVPPQTKAETQQHQHQAAAAGSDVNENAIESIRELGYTDQVIRRAIEIMKGNNPGKSKFEATEILEVVFTITDDETTSTNNPVVSENTSNSQQQNQNSSKQKTGSQGQKTGKGKKSQSKAKASSTTNQSSSTTESSLPSLSVSSLDTTNAAAGLVHDPSNQAISESDIRSLQEENIQLKEQVMCKICMDKNVSIAFLPCGHLACCIDCAPAMRKCPMCRVFIKGTVKTYLA